MQFADVKPTLPSLGELKLVDDEKINILDKIGAGQNKHLAKYLLEDDEDGTILKQIEGDNRGWEANIKRAIFKRWLRGEWKMPVTWRTLVDVLEKMNLTTLARIIRDAPTDSLSPKRRNVSGGTIGVVTQIIIHVHDVYYRIHTHTSSI